MEYSTDRKVYDSPDDITSVDLTIRAVSGNLSPVIYANGRNQLPVEIIAKAMKENPDGSETILKFTAKIWLHILNLRHAESDEKLISQGSSGWCFTSFVNDYSREVNTGDSLTEPRYMEPGDELMTLYVYTDDISSRRIAVSIDTDGGKHFTTADNASGAERCSVSVRAIQPINYSNVQNLKIIPDNWVTRISPLRYKDQQKAIIWANEHYGGFIRRRKFAIVTANGYTITHKNVPPGLSGGYKQSVLYHQKAMPHALLLVTQPDGGYLNSWFVAPDGYERGYLNAINWNFDDMSDPYWPDLYFSDNVEGEYVAGTWAFWPYTEANNNSWEKFPVEDDCISIVCFQLYVPDTSPLYWGSDCRPNYISDPAVPVTLIDLYGNEGTFNITFNSSVAGDISISP